MNSRPPPPPRRTPAAVLQPAAPPRAPLVLLVTGREECERVLAYALALHGIVVYPTNFAQAPALVRTERPDLIVAFGPDAETDELERLIGEAQNIPAAVLAASDGQARTLRSFPPGSVLLIPSADDEFVAIERLAKLATYLAACRQPGGGPSEALRATVQPREGQGSALLGSPSGTPPPPPNRSRISARASGPPPPPDRSRRMASTGGAMPPPPPRRANRGA